MAEDQGVNGDLWNEEVTRLLKKLHWTKVGDSNIDIVGSDEKKMGLDGLFRYKDSRRSPTLDQGIFVESKRYLTTSYSKQLLSEWIDRLNTKITKTKNSEPFKKVFPDYASCTIRNGIIFLWISDTDKYPKFKDTLRDDLCNVKISTGRIEDGYTKVYVIDNYDILRIVSTVEAVDKNYTSKQFDFNYYYPSLEAYPTSIGSFTKTLTIDYIYSQFILGKAKCKEEEVNVVFYFGELSIQGFKRLRSALQKYQHVNAQIPLHIYRYRKDDEFRKIEPEVIDLFSGITSVKIKQMDVHSEIPSHLKNDD